MKGIHNLFDFIVYSLCLPFAIDAAFFFRSESSVKCTTYRVETSTVRLLPTIPKKAVCKKRVRSDDYYFVCDYMDFLNYS